jgi:pilus assembly protein CpaB
MGSARIIILVVAAVAAILLMVIVGRLIGHKPAATGPAPAPVAAAKPMTNVIVASHDLAIGTRLAASDLTTQPWPADAVNPAFITDGHGAAPQPQGASAVVASKTTRAAAEAVNAVTGGKGPMDGLVGAIVRTPILAHEPVINAKLVRGGEGGYMAVVLPEGMRAISVPVNVNTGAGGFILPGDRVDVLQAGQVETPIGGQRPYVAQTILRNVKVLAIDQTSQPPKNGGQSQVGAVATLEVSPEDAVLVALARVRGGEIVLTLRSYADSRGPSGRAGGGTVNLGTVHIIRNGQLSETTVTP